MKKVLLACAAGVTTSLVVKKMTDYAILEDLEVEIKAVPVDSAVNVGDQWDCILLGPQVKFALDRFKGVNEKVAVIPSDIYARGDGKAVLKMALEMIG